MMQAEHGWRRAPCGQRLCVHAAFAGTAAFLLGMAVLAGAVLGIAGPGGGSMAMAANSAQPVLRLDWEALMPADLTEEKLERLMRDKGSWSEDEGVFFEPEFFPVKKELDGRRIQIAGFVVPLDFDAAEISEFMLVPYFGACIHTPPPPPNQIIYVQMSKKFRLKGLSRPVLVTGPLSTKIKKSGIANTGYTMFAERIELYREKSKN